VIAALGLAALAVAAILFVAWPLVRTPSATEIEPEVDARERLLAELRERRDAAYAALRELEVEQRTGKLTDEDYAASKAELRADAIEALRQIEALEAPPEPAATAVPEPEQAPNPL
jgi:cytochrome c-type biogenesis protein CcmI